MAETAGPPCKLHGYAAFLRTPTEPKSPIFGNNLNGKPLEAETLIRAKVKALNERWENRAAKLNKLED